MWIAIFQISTKYEDVFSFKKMVFVNIYTILTCGIELYAAYDTFNGVKNIEEFAFPCIHSVLSNITIYVFYMGMTLKLGAFNEFYQDFRYDLTAEEKMDEKLGLELSDDELEDFQKATSKQLTRAITIQNDEDMDRILDENTEEGSNFSIQQENDARSHSETQK